MKRMKWMFVAIPVALAACGAPEKGNGDEESVSKDEARERAEDGDTTDWCEKFGWYDDGICDEFCGKVDSDCEDQCADDGCVDPDTDTDTDPDPDPDPVPDPDPDPGPDPDPAPGGQEGDLCGGIAGLTCADSLICEQEPGTCSVADAAGTCVVQPDGCPENYAPVCGCDGQTYSNACFALAAGVTIDQDGACAPEEVQCGGFLGQTCADDEYCYFEPGTYCDYADASGVCKPRPDNCTFQIDPVCGCDGMTYDNACFAAQSGTGLFSETACD